MFLTENRIRYTEPSFELSQIRAEALICDSFGVDAESYDAAVDDPEIDSWV